MVSLSQRKILLPALALTLVISTLLYGYHSDLSGSLLKVKGFQGRPSQQFNPNNPSDHEGKESYQEEKIKYKPDGAADNMEVQVTTVHEPVTVFLDKEAASVIQQQYVTVTHNNEVTVTHQAAVTVTQRVKIANDEHLWEHEEITAFHKPNEKPPNFLEKQPAQKYEFPSREQRARYESGDPWRGEAAAVQGSSEQLPRPYAPSREQVGSAAEWMRQTIPGDFKHGSENVFIMLKTGAETQWSRFPPHFMTTLTRTNNFALYSDAAGSMFGHEIINILDDLPAAVKDTQDEFHRYKAYQQMHDEHWNWSPNNLKADGGWVTDKYKNIPMLAHAYDRNPNCEWYVWMDDDSFVFYDNMVKWLDTMDPDQKIYTGSTAGLMMDGEHINFAHGGSVVAVSRGTAKALFGDGGVGGGSLRKQFLDKWAVESMNHCCGDAMVAFALKRELGVTLYPHPDMGGQLHSFGNPFQGESLNSVIQIRERMCVPIVSWHHLTMHDIELLWEYERLWDKDRFITYNDIYRDFMLPYIVDERPNWVLEEGHLTMYTSVELEVPLSDGKKLIAPAESKENCKLACREDVWCTAWSYRDEPHECRLSSMGITLGIAANHWNKNPGWVTGYDLERIREWRHDAECDPLTRDENGVYNDDESTSEGWFLRQLKNAERYTEYLEDSSIPGL